MAVSRTASQTINELREFASFTAAEQFYIERSLEVGRAAEAVPAAGVGTGAGAGSGIRPQAAAYRDLRTLRGKLRRDAPVAEVAGLFAMLVRITAQDLARGALASFAAYRFLYERLLGAAVRPYLPASFCAAAALPQMDPARRTMLLDSIGEMVIATQGWSEREPVFIPCRVLDQPEWDQ